MALDVDALLDELADRIAARLRQRENGAGADGRRLLTVEQAAEYIGRTEAAMNHLTAAGKIPTVRHDRRVMIDVRDLDKWIDDNKR